MFGVVQAIVSLFIAQALPKVRSHQFIDYVRTCIHIEKVSLPVLLPPTTLSPPLFEPPVMTFPVDLKQFRKCVPPRRSERPFVF